MSIYYPLLINLEGQKCLVVGGGQVAKRKVKTLLSYNPEITLVSPQLCPELEELAKEGQIKVEKRQFMASDLKGMKLVFVATNNQELNRQIAGLARRRNIPTNVVDSLELSTFIVPSIMRRGALQLAISTDGQIPALAKKLRQQLESEFDPAFKPYINLLREMRKEVLARFQSERTRKMMLNKLLDAGLLETLRQQGLTKARKKALALLSQGSAGRKSRPKK